MDVTYLDYSKAFDSEHVVLNSNSSQWVNVTSGVPQGSVVGPLLFILHVNDITDGLQDILEMFANDSKLYRIIETTKDVEILQEHLNFKSNWS